MNFNIVICAVGKTISIEGNGSSKKAPFLSTWKIEEENRKKETNELENTLNIMCVYLFSSSDVYYILLP